MTAQIRRLLRVKDTEVTYRTKHGFLLEGDSRVILEGDFGAKLRGQVQLVFTSPPFPLLKKKTYGNYEGRQYCAWLAAYGKVLRDLLTSDGSLVIELGNSWEPNLPVMSTVALEALLALKQEGGFFLCQEFIWYNPARLPTPAQWVNIERIRVKDSFTRLWWLSPSPRPKADNRRVLMPYSKSMEALLSTGKYNSGKRPSGHRIGERSFLTNNKGAIPANVLNPPVEPRSLLIASNTHSADQYLRYCESNKRSPHPARMPLSVAEFFIRLCTDENDLVFDPFAGSNTTGATAEMLGRKWISIEKDRAFALDSSARFSSTL